jgi:hypothetical protein
MKNLKAKKTTRFLILGVFLLISVLLVFIQPWFEFVSANQPNQIPTGSILTVTGTPIGAYIIVNSDNPQINVRAYPDPLAPKVGVLLAGQKVPAKGKSNGYIEVDYPGIPGGLAWVYANLVTVYGELPIVEPPSTSTPLYTATIDPTLAAQFLITLAPTRLPTFTEPPPLVIPTYPAQSSSSPAGGRVPMGMIIVGIGALGIFLGFISLIRGR